MVPDTLVDADEVRLPTVGVAAWAAGGTATSVDTATVDATAATRRVDKTCIKMNPPKHEKQELVATVTTRIRRAPWLVVLIA
jgi:hypothetical protein